MAIADKMAAALADVKTQLEKVTGKEIDVSAEQLAFFSFPVGSSFYEENSQTTWRRIIFEGKFCNSPVRLLDATGRTSTPGLPYTGAMWRTRAGRGQYPQYPYVSLDVFLYFHYSKPWKLNQP